MVEWHEIAAEDAIFDSAKSDRCRLLLVRRLRMFYAEGTVGAECVVKAEGRQPIAIGWGGTIASAMDMCCIFLCGGAAVGRGRVHELKMTSSTEYRESTGRGHDEICWKGGRTCARHNTKVLPSGEDLS